MLTKAWTSLRTALVAGVAVMAALPATAAGRFDGVTVNVLTQTGPAIAEPLQRHAAEFEKATGAKVNVISVPFSDIYQKLLTDWSSGTNAIDAAIFAPQWMVDYAANGLLEDLSPRMAADKDIAEDDVGPFFRDFSQKYNGKSYLVPLDGDFHMIYYRFDILDALHKQPPRTWDDYLDIAKAANGQSYDGTKVYGSCIGKKRNAQGYWFITSVAGAFLQSKGTSQGAFFDPRDFKPLIDNEGFRKALTIYKETGKYGPPDELNLDVTDTRSLMVSGRCALSMDWGDIGTMQIDKTISKVANKIGSVVLPGSDKVVDRDTGKLVACSKDTCPFATDGLNHAPYAAFGGWAGGISAKAKPQVKDAAYALFSYMTQPKQANTDVTIGMTGFNPYRASQFTDMSLWLKAGMNQQAADSYLGAIKESLNSPNMILDLRVPQNQRYQQIVLDTAVARYLAGELDVEATVKTVVQGWNEITEELGKDDELKAYKASIGAK